MARSWEHEAWAEMYRAAMLEMDADRVPAEIETARSAILTRIDELESKKENQELDPLVNALKMLALLQGVLRADASCHRGASYQA